MERPQYGPLVLVSAAHCLLRDSQKGIRIRIWPGFVTSKFAPGLPECVNFRRWTPL